MLKLEKINKIFNKNTINEKNALKDLDLYLKKGDFISIIGGNGAGKSTTLNIISGGIYPDSGDIFLNGENITKLPEYKRAKYFGRVFQDPMKGTASSMEIQENMSIAYRRGKKRGLKLGINKKEKEFFKEKLEILGLGLENRLTTKTGLLSGGQRQALTLIMATLQKPEILLLDEHTAALDPKTASNVLDLTEKIINTDKLTAIMITHNMRDAIRLGNRLIMMYDGKIIYDVSGKEKENLKVSDLLQKFEQASCGNFSNDRMILI